MKVKLNGENLDNTFILQNNFTETVIPIWTDELQISYKKNILIKKHKYLIENLEKKKTELLKQKEHIISIRQNLLELEQKMQQVNDIKSSNKVELENSNSTYNTLINSSLEFLYELYKKFIQYKYCQYDARMNSICTSYDKTTKKLFDYTHTKIISANNQNSQNTDKVPKDEIHEKFDNLEKSIIIFYFELLENLLKENVKNVIRKMDFKLIDVLISNIDSQIRIEQNLKELIELVYEFIKFSPMKVHQDLKNKLDKIIFPNQQNSLNTNIK